MNWMRVKSLAVLGVNFNLHLLRSLVPRRKTDQAKRFQEYFRDDRIAAFTREEHEALEFEGCIACGLCPPHCRVMELSQGRFQGPMHIALCASRSHPDFMEDLDSLLLCAVCGQCEPACPEGVPVARIARQMRSMVLRSAREELPSSYLEAVEKVKAEAWRLTELMPGESRNENQEAVILPRKWADQRLSAGEDLAGLLFKLGFRGRVFKADSLFLAWSLGVDPDLSQAKTLLPDKPGKIFVADPHDCALLKKLLPERAEDVVFLLGRDTGSLVEKGKTLKGKVEEPIATLEPAVPATVSGLSRPIRNLLSVAGLKLLEISAEDAAPPAGWEGGLLFSDPRLSRRLSEARLEEAKSAGAASVVCLSFHDAEILGSHCRDFGLRVIYILDLLREAFS